MAFMSSEHRRGCIQSALARRWTAKSRVAPD